MDLKDLLAKHKLDSDHVLVMRHVPQQRKLKSMLPWLAAKSPNVFNAYQQCQNATVGKAMMKAQFVASFIGMEPKRAVFVGLYRRGAYREITDEQFWSNEGAAELRKYGTQGITNGETALWIDLECLDFYPEWKGRLEIDWPAPEISWYRLAKPLTNFPIRAIHHISRFDQDMPSWRELLFTWDQLEYLPPSWELEMQRWRGIYFIFDQREQKGYVGSALSILERWRDHVARRGDAAKLKQCDPQNFRFSILERTSPDMEVDELIRRETTWKERLHTREFGLNDN